MLFIVFAVDEQAGRSPRLFLEKIRYEAGSSPEARSRADFIAGCYNMWRHSLARLVDTRYSTYMYILTRSCSYIPTTYMIEMFDNVYNYS